MSKQKLLLSGDVELAPGLLTFKKINDVSSPALSVLELRLHQFGLKLLGVSGAGDCFV